MENKEEIKENSKLIIKLLGIHLKEVNLEDSQTRKRSHGQGKPIICGENFLI